MLNSISGNPRSGYNRDMEQNIKRVRLQPPRTRRRFSIDEMKAAVRATHGNVSAAARLLGCDPHTIFKRVGNEFISEIRQERTDWRTEVAESEFDKMLTKGDWRAITSILDKDWHRRYPEPEPLISATPDLDVDTVVSELSKIYTERI